MNNNFKMIYGIDARDLLEYILGEDIFSDKVESRSKGNKTIETINNSIKEIKLPKIKQQIKEQEYIPQKGDEVVTIGDIEGIVGSTKGVIVDKVELLDEYLVQISEKNVLYIPKDNLKVIRKKNDVDKQDKIDKLNKEICEVTYERDNVTGKLNLIENHLDELHKELEKLEE